MSEGPQAQRVRPPPGTRYRGRKLAVVGLGTVAGACAVFALLSAAWAVGLIHTIPPRALTHTAMWVMKRRIVRYAYAHGTAPASVEELPVLDGHIDRVTDAWDNPITMEILGDRVVLRSLGRDELPGGDGEDQDMVGVFSLHATDGAWADELADWIEHPYGD